MGEIQKMMGETQKMDDQQHTELLELYKLHSKSADLVSLRRERMHHLFVSVFAILFLLLGVRLASSPLPTAVKFAASIAGILLSITWLALVRSYQQLNTGKFKALDVLENDLKYPFYRIEWKELGKGKKIRLYAKLSVVERALPLVFLLLSVGILFLP